jgi:hypothetical protein
MACLDYMNIPQSLLPQGPSSVQQVKAIGTLKAYAFITERQRSVEDPSGEKFYDMHRLVHMASVAWLREHNKWAHWTGEVSSRLLTLMPRETELDFMGAWRSYLPHATHVAELDGVANETEQIQLLAQVGTCQFNLGRYSLADPIFRKVLSRGTNVLGEDNSLIADTSILLGRVLIDPGRFTEAAFILRQASTRMERASCFGAEHPETLSSRSMLARALVHQFKYDESESILRHTLKQQQLHVSLGPEHPDTLYTMSSFVNLLVRQRKLDEAEEVGRHALLLHEKCFGTRRILTLGSMSILSWVLSSKGNCNEEEALQRQVLRLSKQLLGLEHPFTLNVSGGFAISLILQESHVEAEEILTQLVPT